MYSSDKNQYKRVVSPSEIVAGYYPPTNNQARYEGTNIIYEDVKEDQVSIRQKYLPLLLRELRLQGSEAWNFAIIFQNKGKPMQGLKEFEASLQASPTTALIDYWLLRLGGVIQELPKSDAQDAQYLTDLYDNLVKKMFIYEQEIGKLANNPSRHQNAERQKLAQQFQQECQGLIQPAEQKFKQKDVKNILKNLAAALTGFGLLWLFCKNLYRLTQRKELGLFQFAEANSRKLEHLQKLYDDLPKATAADAAELHNFFTSDINDAYQSLEEFLKLIAELQTLYNTTDIRGTYTNQDKKDLKLTINSFIGVLDSFQQELSAFQQNPEQGESLAEIQEDFMGHWRSATKSHKLAKHFSEQSHYSPACQEKFRKIVAIAEEFGAEIETMQSKRARGPSSPGGSSTSGSDF